MKKAFEKYVKNYDMNDTEINYKYHHSYRVAKFSDMISQNMSKEDQKLAHIIGLYHDIGRFEQDKIFDNFSDNKTFDHGDYGVEVLFKQKLIKEIPIEEKYYNIIEKAIKNHNKYGIEDNLEEQELLHAKLIRDADKLDIIYAISENIFNKREIDFESDEEIREEIKKQFFSNQTINYKKINSPLNKSEKLIALLALIFDLNFKKSLKYIKENNLLEKINGHIKNKEYYKDYFDYLNNYIKEETKC